MEDRIINVLRQFLPDIQPDSDVDSVDMWDSIIHLQFILALEEEFFPIKFTPEEIAEMVSVKRMKEIIGDKSAS
jgi:acyl carrier protein